VRKSQEKGARKSFSVSVISNKRRFILFLKILWELRSPLQN